MGSGIYGVKIFPSGIEQVFKSGGMRSALEAVVAPIASSANSNFGLRAGDRVPVKVKNGKPHLPQGQPQPSRRP